MHENFKLSRRSLLGRLAAASVVAGVGSRKASAQSGSTTEVSYNGFLDPANAKDPRAAAQNRMIEAFEKANPSIKIKVVVDPSGANGIRAARARAGAPDVMRVTNFQQPEYSSTGSILPIDELVARDGVDTNDWLIPLEQTKVNGQLWGLQQDFRIPIFIYRKSQFAEAQITSTPGTYEEVGGLGAKLTKGATIGYAVPLGITGGIGGAQAFNEFITSSILAGNDGPLFAPDGRNIAFADDRLLLAASTVSDLFAKKASTPVSLQYGYNELQDGLRSGTVASASFGLYRYKGIEKAIADNDLAWAPAPTIARNDKLTAYGFQLSINANSPNKEAAWEFVKFMASPEAQALAARGGEVVARASVYKDPYFSTPEAADQLGWKNLVQERGRLVTYSVIQSIFNQIAGEEFQRMILRGSTPESVVSQVKSRYAEALSKS
ncbi:extracellular solute-binding protein [Agrobacterium tumefaciens]|uniref:extracellular solute-binding protein n=1 Tax=Agrobacterium fabrum TaxID=1176649 RepID=UPI0015723962|nr:extracellular solute-binding protein [Agrobacterium fabrum]NTE84505.1 extracellular solute-binding protein [Agrobacterium tumefaciens]